MTRPRRAAVALAAVCMGLAAGGAAHAKTKKHKHEHHHHHHHQKSGSDPSAEGKDHLKRANALAGDGNCEAAIEEYTKAYDLLDDPVVLFNRGECYRRTGDGENAADDYRTFLEKVPNAPNRADIEAKIVALEAPEPAARETAKAPAREKAREPATPPPPAPPKAAEDHPPPAPPPPEPKPETRHEPAVTVRAARDQDSEATGGSRPWVWIALSVLVVGAAVGGYFLLRPHEQPPPETALGNYRF